MRDARQQRPSARPELDQGRDLPGYFADAVEQVFRKLDLRSSDKNTFPSASHACMLNTNNLNLPPPFFDDDTLHPVEFIREFEKCLLNAGIEFRNCPFSWRNQFRGRAKTWANVFFGNSNSFLEFKNCFLDYFWSAEKQNKVRLALETQRYQYSEGSFSNYFMKWIAKGKFLVPPYSDRMLIATVARHFPPEIACSLISSETVFQALKCLQQADYYYRFDEPNERSENNRSTRFNLRPSSPGPRSGGKDVEQRRDEVRQENFTSREREAFRPRERDNSFSSGRENNSPFNRNIPKRPFSPVNTKAVAFLNEPSIEESHSGNERDPSEI
jgi:hypothetical protein